MLDILTPLELCLFIYSAVMTLFALVAVFAPGRTSDPRVAHMREQIGKEGYHV